MTETTEEKAAREQRLGLRSYWLYACPSMPELTEWPASLTAEGRAKWVGHGVAMDTASRREVSAEIEASAEAYRIAAACAEHDTGHMRAMAAMNALHPIAERLAGRPHVLGGRHV